MNKFYVYLHRKATNNEIFYVGKGCGNRASTKRGRSSYWTRIANKHGFVIQYLDTDLDEEKAFELEEFAISFIGSTAKLCNLTSGGEGCSRGKDPALSLRNKDRIWTEEAKAKISKANKGRKRSEEAILASTLKGLKSGMSDKRLHLFQRIDDGLVVRTTRSELCESFGIKPEQLKLLFGVRKRKTSKGWKLLSEGQQCQEQNEN